MEIEIVAVVLVAVVAAAVVGKAVNLRLLAAEVVRKDCNLLAAVQIPLADTAVLVGTHLQMVGKLHWVVRWAVDAVQ